MIFAAVQIAMPVWVRPHLIPAARLTRPARFLARGAAPVANVTSLNQTGAQNGRLPRPERRSAVGRPVRHGRMVRVCGNRLPGGEAERFGVGTAVMLGQDLAEVAGPVGDGAVADLAARDRKMGNGHGEAAGTGIAHHLYDASSAGVTWPCAIRTPRGQMRISEVAGGGSFCGVVVYTDAGRTWHVDIQVKTFVLDAGEPAGFLRMEPRSAGSEVEHDRNRRVPPAAESVIQAR